MPFGALCGVWGVTLGRFGVLLEGLGVCGGALWAALGCLWELLGCGPLWGALGCLWELLGCVGSLWAALEVMLLWDVSVITKMNQKWWSVAQNQTLGCFGDHQNEPRVMECCSKADFGMFFGRGQYDKSDGELLQNKFSGTHSRRSRRPPRPPKWCQDPWLGPPLPRALGARMT